MASQRAPRRSRASRSLRPPRAAAMASARSWFGSICAPRRGIRTLLAALVSAPPSAIVIPKVNGPEDVLRASDDLAAVGMPASVRLWAMIETPRAILDIVEKIAGAVESEYYRLETLMLRAKRHRQIDARPADQGPAWPPRLALGGRARRQGARDQYHRRHLQRFRSTKRGCGPRPSRVATSAWTAEC